MTVFDSYLWVFAKFRYNVFNITLISWENRTKFFSAHTLSTLPTIKKEAKREASAINFLTHLTPFPQ